MAERAESSGPLPLLFYCKRHSGMLAILGLLTLPSLVPRFVHYAVKLIDYEWFASQRTFPAPPWSGPRGAYNLSALDQRLDRGTLIDRSDFHYLLNSDRCKAPLDDLFLVVFVHSAPAHWDRRRTIRDTWGNVCVLRAVTAKKMAIVFMVGRPDDAGELEALALEGSIHGDLVIGNFADSYRNLTYKHVMGLKWVTYFCRNARYVLKTDDDVFMDLFRLTSYLRSVFGELAPPKLMVCLLIRRAVVKRSYRSKWRVGFDEYHGRRYPPYCLGFGVVMSPDVVFHLYRASTGTSYFWIDDVFVTGILARRIGLMHVDLAEHLGGSGDEALAWLGQARQESPPFMGFWNLDTESIYRLWNKTTRCYAMHVS